MIRAYRNCWEVQPPTGWDGLPRPWVFLGGAIDNGNAPNWQAEVIHWLRTHVVTLLNPRRADWDPHPTPERMREQIEWELKGQETADLRLYVFPAHCHAPITLLELGLFHQRPTLVYLDYEYTRYWNVKITCERYGISYTRDWNEYRERLINFLREWAAR